MTLDGNSSKGNSERMNADYMHVVKYKYYLSNFYKDNQPFNTIHIALYKTLETL